MTTVTALCAVVLLSAFPAALPAAAEMSPKELKKTLKKADRDWQSGKTAAACELYEDVLAATAPGNEGRADALYRLVLVSLGDSERWNPERGRELLTELEGHSRHPRRLEIGLFRALLAAREAEADQVRRLSQELERARNAIETARAAAPPEPKEPSVHVETLEAAVTAVQEQLQAADQEIATLRAELESTRSELAQKEKALENLTKRALGRSDG